jgi:hypothetical protein
MSSSHQQHGLLLLLAALATGSAAWVSPTTADKIFGNDLFDPGSSVSLLSGPTFNHSSSRKCFVAISSLVGSTHLLGETAFTHLIYAATPQ